MFLNIALLLFAQGELEEANLLYSRALFIKTTVFGEDHEIAATAMQNLATVYQAQGKNDEAKQLFDQTLEYTWYDLTCCCVCSNCCYET